MRGEDSVYKVVKSPGLRFELSISRMKIDIHNHILPKEWPDLKQVGCLRRESYL